jgi:hypothetical protein
MLDVEGCKRQQSVPYHELVLKGSEEASNEALISADVKRGTKNGTIETFIRSNR